MIIVTLVSLLIISILNIIFGYNESKQGNHKLAIFDGFAAGCCFITIIHIIAKFLY